jgi:hypothetical protein
LRKLVYSRADYKCEICDAGGVPVECHEVWNFDLEKKVQRLKYLVCLCNACHKAKHFGHAYLSGSGHQALKHLMKVNSWSLEETLDYIDKVYIKHKRFKGIKFRKKLDTKLLDDFIAKFQIKDRKTKNAKPKKRSKKRVLKKSAGNYRKGQKRIW